MLSELWIDVIGWAGAALILVGYGLITSKRVDGSSAAYQLMNLLGSIGLIANSYYYGAFPSLGVNVVWMAIATIGLAQMRRRSAPTRSL